MFVFDCKNDIEDQYSHYLWKFSSALMGTLKKQITIRIYFHHLKVIAFSHFVKTENTILLEVLYAHDMVHGA